MVTHENKAKCTANFEEILLRHWGFASFRPLQRDIIEAVYEGYDVVGLMPTGGGKSITFQVPALLLPGVCVVVTPLIALMKDQVNNLNNRGIRAAFVHSGMRQDEIILTLDNVANGPFKFLYISPERIGSNLFISKFKAMIVSMIVVDEAHCISQWGYDFRPSYLKIARLREHAPDAPILALTATATPDVVKDIQLHLEFRQTKLFRKSFVRNNLHYVVRPTANKEAETLHILNQTQGCAIVYTRNRKKTEDFARFLSENGISATAYHAGLKTIEKNERQDAWIQNKCRVIVATNAFGMGIDKPDVRVVIHLDAPSSLEEYYQEAGRAGRDELTAYCVLLYKSDDAALMKRRVSETFPERDFIKMVYDLLGSYLRVGVGSGYEASFDFELWHFCRQYRLPAAPTENALHILEMAGYITYRPDGTRFTCVQIVLSKAELYLIDKVNPDTDLLLDDLLRNYTGLFADFVFIVEEEISRRTNLTPRHIYDLLLALAKRGIIRFIPRKSTPRITFEQRRDPIEYVSIPRDILERRCGNFQERLDQILHYMQKEEGCRVLSFLDYFGEENGVACGKCDLCLSRKRTQQNEQATHERVRNEVLEAIRHLHCTSVEELLKTVHANRILILEIYRTLIDEHLITPLQQ